MEEYRDSVNKRKDLRVPVRVPLHIKIKNVDRTIEFKTYILNYSHGGMCIEWNLCEECTGYSFGEIHPDCIFGPYESGDDNTGVIDFYLEKENRESDLHFTGKAVYTFKQGDSEQVGVIFISISEEIRELICPNT